MISRSIGYDLIKVLSFDDIFGGSEGYGEISYFSSFNDFYIFFETLQTLPISRILSRVEVSDTYSGGYTTYSDANREDDMLILKQTNLNDIGLQNKDYITKIKVSDFSYISVVYLTGANTINFSFETKQEPQITFNLTFALEHRVRLITNKLKKNNNITIEPLYIRDLYKIFDIIHDEKLKWYEKSIFIHQIVLNTNEIDFKSMSLDRKTEIERWVKQCENMYWTEIQEADDFDDFYCECSEHMYSWIDFSCVALAQTILFIIYEKKLTLTAKAIMIYIAFHSYSYNRYDGRTVQCMKNLTKDNHNSTESGLNQLVKKGWLTSSELYSEEICNWSCKNLGYHVCVDEHYYFTNEFKYLVGWNVDLGNPITY